MNVLIQFISITVTLLTWLVFLHVILSFFMSPYHPIRETIDQILKPVLDPIRQILPSMGGFDFSPMVLWILIQLIGNIAINILITFS